MVEPRTFISAFPELYLKRLDGVKGDDPATGLGGVALRRRGLHDHELDGGNQQHDCKKTAKGYVRKSATAQVRSDDPANNRYNSPIADVAW
jgi:hypothetical protein